MGPFEATLGHELAHTYIPHEGLTQFLDLHVYYVARTGSTDPHSWIITYMPVLPMAGALLDVYQLIGQGPMSAYTAIHALRPAYGQPLSDEGKQVFIDAAPAGLRPRVTELMAGVTY